MKAKEYSSAATEAAHIAIVGSFDKEMWIDIRTGVIAVCVLLMRIMFLITLPLSVPVLTWLIIKDGRLRVRQSAEARQRMRDAMHRVGHKK